MCYPNRWKWTLGGSNKGIFPLIWLYLHFSDYHILFHVDLKSDNWLIFIIYFYLSIILFSVEFWDQLSTQHSWENPPSNIVFSIVKTNSNQNTCVWLYSQLSEGRTQSQLEQCVPLLECGLDSYPKSEESPGQTE